LKYLNEVELLIHSFLQEEGLYSSQMGYIVLTVCESVNNAIVHGNNEDAAKFVDIRLERINNELVIEIEDEGIGFNILEVPDPTESDNIKNESGRGIFIIKNLADHVEFQNNGSLVKIKFNLKSEHQFLF
jgi:serine/threonine-protein kinase RsbW